MALLQFFNSKPSEEHLFRTLKALGKFLTVSSRIIIVLLLVNYIGNINTQVSPDIPQLVQMIGPHPSTFKGTSPRVDEIIAEISKKVR